MKNTLLCTIAATGLLYSGAALAQAQAQGEACERLGAYMEENRDRDLGVDLNRLGRLQQSGDEELCREQLAVFEEEFGRRDSADAAGQQQQPTGQLQTDEQRLTEGQTDQQQTEQQRLTEGQPTGQEQTEQQRRQTAQQDGQQQGGEIVVEQTAPSVRIDQPEPEITVRQTAPDVSVSQGQPEIIVRQPAPQVTVHIPQPEITVRMPQPEVAVSQQPPQVEVSQQDPQVRIEQPEEQARVMMEQNEPATVQIQRPQEQARVQLQDSGQPLVRYEAEEAQVRIQRDEGQPTVQIEPLPGQDQASAGGQQQQGQDQQTAARVQQDGEALQEQETGSTAADQQQTGQQLATGEQQPVDQQQTAAVTQQETEPMQATGNLQRISADELIGMPLMNAQGDQLGEVEDLVLSTEENRTFAVIEHGGFLGLGEKKIVLPLDNLQVMEDAVIVQGMTDQDIEALPEYEEDENAYRALEAGEQAEIRFGG
ncbi:MAG TPA: PRC-barrel domain-containing protein [Methylomirabilota bacterium]|nr:PRC-barrel domain-containing protein [Methylomirabilota bacterium]